MGEIAIADAMSRHQDELLALPNVTGVGVGERAGEPVIKVFVTRKVPESALTPEERVPSSLEGYQVDVEEIGSIEAEEK